MKTWRSHFTKEQLEVIDASKEYQRNFPQWENTNDAIIIIAKLVNILDEGVVPNGEAKKAEDGHET